MADHCSKVSPTPFTVKRRPTRQGLTETAAAADAAARTVRLHVARGDRPHRPKDDAKHTCTFAQCHIFDPSTLPRTLFASFTPLYCILIRRGFGIWHQVRTGTQRILRPGGWWCETSRQGVHSCVTSQCPSLLLFPNPSPPFRSVSSRQTLFPRTALSAEHRHLRVPATEQRAKWKTD